MIRLFAQVFDFGNIFLKSKTNMGEDKKENFGMEIVKKRLGFRSHSICRVEVYPPLMFRTCAAETMKSFISLFLFLTNLCFQVVIVLLKTRFILHISYIFETFHKSLVTRFLTVCYVSQEYLEVFRSSRPFCR